MKQNYLKKLMTALLLLCCTVAGAADFEVGGIYYNILSSEDKTVEVTSGSNKYIGAVTIPASVTYKSITYSVTSIGYEAFAYCTGLTSIEIPSSVTSIGNSAFEGCRGLTSIEIPSSVTSIGNYAFRLCNGLTSIEITSSVTSIGGAAFSGCEQLYSIVVDKENTVYDSRGNCNAIIETASNTLIGGCVNTIIPEGVTSIGYEVFAYYSRLTSIEIPASVTSIGYGAFSGCSGLTSIKIPEGVTSIGEWAFSSCSGLTSIEIPASVTSIGQSAFHNCSGLTSVTIGNGVTSIGGCAFFNCTGLTSVTIGNGVTSIEEYAFHNCRGLTSIEIPASVTSIGECAFSSCYGLTSITSHIAAEDLFVPDNGAFGGVGKTNCTLYVPAGAKSTYAATDGWKEFKNIVEMSSDGSDATAIESVETESTAPAVYYDLSGRRVENPTKGIYIVNGRKFFIK